MATHNAQIGAPITKVKLNHDVFHHVVEQMEPNERSKTLKSLRLVNQDMNSLASHQFFAVLDVRKHVSSAGSLDHLNALRSGFTEATRQKALRHFSQLQARRKQIRKVILRLGDEPKLLANDVHLQLRLLEVLDLEDVYEVQIFVADIAQALLYNQFKQLYQADFGLKSSRLIRLSYKMYDRAKISPGHQDHVKPIMDFMHRQIERHSYRHRLVLHFHQIAHHSNLVDNASDVEFLVIFDPQQERDKQGQCLINTKLELIRLKLRVARTQPYVRAAMALYDLTVYRLDLQYMTELLKDSAIVSSIELDMFDDFLGHCDQFLKSVMTALKQYLSHLQHKRNQSPNSLSIDFRGLPLLKITSSQEVIQVHIYVEDHKYRAEPWFQVIELVEHVLVSRCKAELHISFGRRAHVHLESNLAEAILAWSHSHKILFEFWHQYGSCRELRAVAYTNPGVKVEAHRLIDSSHSNHGFDEGSIVAFDSLWDLFK